MTKTKSLSHTITPSLKGSNGSSRKSLRRVREQLALPLVTPLPSSPAGPSIRSLTPQRLGTFQDSLRAPIHGWFKYPAGYSYKLIDTLIEDYNLGEDSWLLDPFAGCGTTLVEAKYRGVNSVGIEAHPFVYWVAKTKCFWDYDMGALHRRVQKLLAALNRRPPFPGKKALEEFPALIHKCYSDDNLWTLKFIRDAIQDFECSEEERDFLKLALTDTLRGASKAGTGWPYIAPSKYQEKIERPGLEVFAETVRKMYSDLKQVLASRRGHSAQARPIHMDTRQPYPLKADSIDLAVTSPPYLNNYDYADRTRLETYFFGLAKSWGDITEQIRDKLIVAATTQIRRTAFDDKPLRLELKELIPSLYEELAEKVHLLGKRRLQKGGKKNYDLMVAGYFNDMLPMMRNVHRVLKPNAHFFLVLGDSAPYGVYIPTEEYLGRLGRAIGFRNYTIQALRSRGDKWKDNPQRHNIKLKESILVLQK
jgi:DNA modification methylase